LLVCFFVALCCTVRMVALVAPAPSQVPSTILCNDAALLKAGYIEPKSQGFRSATSTEATLEEVSEDVDLTESDDDVDLTEDDDVNPTNDDHVDLTEGEDVNSAEDDHLDLTENDYVNLTVDDACMCLSDSHIDDINFTELALADAAIWQPLAYSGETHFSDLEAAGHSSSSARFFPETAPMEFTSSDYDWLQACATIGWEHRCVGRLVAEPPGLETTQSLKPQPMRVPGNEVHGSVLKMTSVLFQSHLPVKSRMCDFFRQGRCTRGAKCLFAHSHSELRDAPDLSKTKLCASVVSGGRCQGTGCRFAHHYRELRSIGSEYKTNHSC